jgi:hypothetical protein
MAVDLPAAARFMAAHARMLDRRRFTLLLEDAGPSATLAALSAYRNADGGYGWGLEPDLRSTESQPGGAFHAMEVFEDAAPVTASEATELCDWLASVSLADGGLPFALPVTDPAACAPFWVGADHTVSSLQITALVAAHAHRVAEHDPAVRRHPWLARATEYCFSAIDAIEDQPHALVLMAALRLADAAGDVARVSRLGELVPAGGLLHVAGGLDDEYVRPLDIAPLPGRPVRDLFDARTIGSELERLAGLQRDDGGWPVDFTSYSPAATLEWRGYTTVRALWILRGNALA